MPRGFGPGRRPLYRAPEKREAPADTCLREIGQRCYVVDGYNVIFDWDELHALAERDLSAARERLMDTLCGWAAFNHTQVVLATRSPAAWGRSSTIAASMWCTPRSGRPATCTSSGFCSRWGKTTTSGW